MERKKKELKITKILKSCLRRSSYFLFLIGLCLALGVLAFFYTTSPQMGTNSKRHFSFNPDTSQSLRKIENVKNVSSSSSNVIVRERILDQNSIQNKKPEKCKEKQKIGFLKTHKTASSSVQNIFLRYGFMNRLDFVLPSRGNHLSNPKHFNLNLDRFQVDFLDQESSKLLWHKKLKETQGYNIFALHSCWDQKEVSSLLGPNASYVTILRKPGDVFESLYSYVNFQSKLKLTLSQYIRSLNVSSTLFQHRLNGYLGLNQQLYDLGQNRSDLYDRSETESMIKTMEENFDLVMIAEKFDESVILLANLLCWPLEKVTSLKVNVRKPELKQNISKEESSILSQWQEGDEMVYKHFSKILDEQIESFGRERMEKSLNRLRQLNAEAEKRCVLGVTDKQHLEKESELAPWSPDVIAYKVPETDFQCTLMAMNENSFVDKVRNSQTIRWKSKVKTTTSTTAKIRKDHKASKTKGSHHNS